MKETLMQKRRLGHTDLTIAPLVLGGNVFGWTTDKKASFAVMDRFVDAGLNAIDTADVYSAWAPGNSGGESETIMGEWMKARGNRGRVIIITKVGSPMGKGKEGLSARYIEEAVDASLKRLETDAIDLYLSHWPDMATPIEETLKAYQRLIAKGKIRWCGASNLNVALLEAALAAAKAKGLPRYEVLQPEYNLADRSGFENGLADLCEREEIGVITYFSLAKGFLSGKYRAETDLAKSPRGGGVKDYLNPRGFRILDALEAVASRNKAKPAEVALAWIMARPGVTAPIASATSLEQVDSLVRATELTLPADDMAALTEASAP
jgi:aryl-alcohol dehydrogenase-like predicted oxidoreductase